MDGSLVEGEERGNAEWFIASEGHNAEIERCLGFPEEE